MEKEIIISTLENCIGNGQCDGFPFNASIPGYINFPGCMVELQREALKIIKGMEVNA